MLIPPAEIDHMDNQFYKAQIAIVRNVILVGSVSIMLYFGLSYIENI